MTSDPSMSDTDSNPESTPQDPAVITGMASEAPDRTFSLLTLASGLPVQEGHPVRIPQSIVDKLRIRHGHLLEAEVQQRTIRTRRGKRQRREVTKVLQVEHLDPEAHQSRPSFEDLVPIDPAPRLTLEHEGGPISSRMIDLFCPIGFGTRGLIVSPPKAGKTTLLRDIATSVSVNHPQVRIIAVLIDERPEEVTEFTRHVPGEVLASSNDMDLETHTDLALFAYARARRLLEAGEDVLFLVDSLTRLGRAFNNDRRYATGGRTMSGGIDTMALDWPKRIFGTARNVEGPGSLIMPATCLVDTGGRGDQVIFEEFKGTGNMELVLDRSVAEQRLYPAIDLAGSGTRKEDLLLSEGAHQTITALRRRLINMKPPQQVAQLLKAMERVPTNELLVQGGRPSDASK